MKRTSMRESIQQQIQIASGELSKLQSSKHILTGQKAWNVFDRKRETLERQLRDTIEEYQRILGHSHNRAASTL